MKLEYESWEAALTKWLDGNIVSEESRRYISNFISIHRLRPSEDNNVMDNSDDMVDDEEVQVTSEMLDSVLDTRVG